MAEYIGRDAAVKVVLRERKPTNSVAQNRMLSIIQHGLLTARAADVAPVVHGHRVDNGGFYARCSQCDGVLPLCANYCPNCGAKMDGERKDGGESDSKPLGLSRAEPPANG